jgi:hypothetical protein
VAPGSALSCAVSAWHGRRDGAGYGDGGWIPSAQPLSRWIEVGRWSSRLHRDGISGSLLVGSESKGDSL